MMTNLRVEELELLRWPVTMALLGVFSLFCLLLFIGAIVHRSGLRHIFTFVKPETKRGNMSFITSYHVFTILCSLPPKLFQPSNSDRVLCLRLVLHHPPLAPRLHLRHHGRRPRGLLLQVQEQSDHCTIDHFVAIMILGQHRGCRGLSTRRST